MKKIILLFFLCSFMNFCLAEEIYDAEWCRKNGGVIEFDFEYNINFNCITNDIKRLPYIKSLYNIICIPYFSSVAHKTEPRFLKIVSCEENQKGTFFDKYNWKITEAELIKYI